MWGGRRATVLSLGSLYTYNDRQSITHNRWLWFLNGFPTPNRGLVRSALWLGREDPSISHGLRFFKADGPTQEPAPEENFPPQKSSELSKTEQQKRQIYSNSFPFLSSSTQRDLPNTGYNNGRVIYQDAVRRGILATDKMPNLLPVR